MFRKLAQVSTLAISLVAAAGSSAHADGWAAVAGPHGGAAAVNYQGGHVFRGGRGAMGAQSPGPPPSVS